MKKTLINFLCLFIPFARIRHGLQRGDNLSSRSVSILVIENGKERKAKRKECRFLKVKGSGTGNVIKIETPIHKKLHVNIAYCHSNNNHTIIHKNVYGDWKIAYNDFDNCVEIGEETSCCNVDIRLIGNTLKIGKGCMLSNNIHIWGDGHSVLDFKTKAVLNKPTAPILIGDHCWLGERVSLTKNAGLANDCIVGLASVVTKKFTEEHCVLAGAPAKVVKTGVTWHGDSPLTYDEKRKQKEEK